LPLLCTHPRIPPLATRSSASQGAERQRMRVRSRAAGDAEGSSFCGKMAWCACSSVP